MNSDLLKEAIADAKAVKETALANAKMALEEAFTPKLQSMLSHKLAEELDEEEDEEGPKDETYHNEDDDMENEMMKSEDDDMENEMMKSEEEEEEGPKDETYQEEGEDEDPVGEELDSDEEEEVKDIASDEIDSHEEEMHDEGEDEDDDEDNLDLESVIAELEASLNEEEDEDDEEDELEELDSSDIGDGENAEPSDDAADSSDIDNDDELSLDEIIETLKELAEEDDDEPVSEEEDDDLENEMMAKDEELKEAYATIESLRGTINEVNLLNAKLLYTNKLFRTFDLNEGQKMKVIENFDRAASLREVKLVFATLGENLNVAKKPKTVVKESLASKPTKSTAPSKEIISEGNQVADRFKKLAGLIK